MGRIALISREVEERHDFLTNLGVPDNYMGDFSVVGIVVDRYRESVAILEKEGFSIEKIGAGSVIDFNDSASVPRIIDMLGANSIGCEYQDIANLFYQA